MGQIKKITVFLIVCGLVAFFTESYKSNHYLIIVDGWAHYSVMWPGCDGCYLRKADDGFKVIVTDTLPHLVWDDGEVFHFMPVNDREIIQIK